jgi:hypothetical protein
MSGYEAAYRGVVIDATDPESRNRVQVQVPDVLGDQTAWAAPEEPTASLPSVGDEVTVHFENGDEAHPLWRPGTPPAATPHQAAGYHATYRGVVINNVDPGGYRRVQVTVPDVSTETLWAMPESADARLPAISDEVVIRFEGGDVEHPQWSGGSGTGEQTSLEGTHRATVTSNIDPAGFGRLYVQVPGITEGVWATPEQAPPGMGDEVSVRFDGDVDHAIWTR